jgi:hypothetical protein
VVRRLARGVRIVLEAGRTVLAYDRRVDVPIAPAYAHLADGLIVPACARIGQATVRV